MKYLIVDEKSSDAWGAYAPALPGLGVVARTLETKPLIREAIEFYFDGMRQRGDPIPDPSSQTNTSLWPELTVEPLCNELKADS